MSTEKTEEIITDEWDDELELKRKKLPRIYDLALDMQLVVKNEKIEIKDLFLRESDSEKIIWTYAVAVLQPNTENEDIQLRPWVPLESDVKYQVIEGGGSVVSAELSRPIKKGKLYVVQKNVRHNIKNGSMTEGLVVEMDYAGFIDFRNVYRPVSQRAKEARDSTEKLFNIKKEELKEKETPKVPKV